MTLSPAVTGAIRSVVSVAIFGAVAAVLNFLGDSTHLQGVTNDSLALLIAAVASSLEHQMEAKNGTALFGSVAVRK